LNKLLQETWSTEKDMNANNQPKRQLTSYLSSKSTVSKKSIAHDKENISSSSLKLGSSSNFNQVPGKLKRKAAERIPPLKLDVRDETLADDQECVLTDYVTRLPARESYVPHMVEPPTSSQQVVNAAVDNGLVAVVEFPGYISLKLRFDVVLDISADMGIRLTNPTKCSSLVMSPCLTQMALIHPKGRVLQYGDRVEVQSEDFVSVKNAKIYPRGVSFTANDMALVYLLDEAGARSTQDSFHDLYATIITDMLFQEFFRDGYPPIAISIRLLEETRYWKLGNGSDCWVIGGLFIQQTVDGLVTVRREVPDGSYMVKTSPGNGKIKFDSPFLKVTASLGEESHLFLKSAERRLHYNGENKRFTVRNAGHSAGFDERGNFTIF